MHVIKNRWLYFVIVVILTISFNKGYKTFLFRPCSAHQWRQSDGASYALNYYQNKVSFLPPQVNHRFAKDGKAVSEFPIVYYVAGKLYSIFGFHDYFIRLIHFAIFLLGLIYLVKITSLFTKNILLQLLPFLFTISSPYLFYYGANFLPDVAALSLSIVGLYYFLLFEMKKQQKYIFLFCFFFTLAALLKLSDIILLLAVIGYYLWQMFFNKTYKSSISRKNQWLIFMLSFISICILYSWVKYDQYVADHYHFGGNLIGLLGIWDIDKSQIIYILSRLYRNWMHVVLAKFIWLALLIGIVILGMNFRKIYFPLRVLLLLSALGVIAYLLAFFQVFDVHDYYLINAFCLPVLILIALVDIIEKKQWMQKKPFAYFLTAGILALFAYASYKSAYEQNYRFFGKDYNGFNKDYYSVEPYLRKIGISKDDLVVSVPDASPNVTLYLMNQIGYTECYNNDDYNINYFVYGEKVKYLIVGDSSYISKPLYQPFCKPENKIGQYKSISIYKTQ